MAMCKTDLLTLIF
jgi:hypothetical protein